VKKLGSSSAEMTEVTNTFLWDLAGRRAANDKPWKRDKSKFNKHFSQFNNWVGLCGEGTSAFMLNGEINKDPSKPGGSDVLGIRWSDGTPISIDAKGVISRYQGLYVECRAEEHDVYILVHQGSHYPRYKYREDVERIRKIRTWNIYGWCTRAELVEAEVRQWGGRDCFYMPVSYQNRKKNIFDQTKLHLFTQLYDITWGREWYDGYEKYHGRLEMGKKRPAAGVSGTAGQGPGGEPGGDAGAAVGREV